MENAYRSQMAEGFLKKLGKGSPIETFRKVRNVIEDKVKILMQKILIEKKKE